jgi:hypothetical protein
MDKMGIKLEMEILSCVGLSEFLIQSLDHKFPKDFIKLQFYDPKKRESAPLNI